jgi:hypothetical protein
MAWTGTLLWRAKSPTWRGPVEDRGIDTGMSRLNEANEVVLGAQIPI